MTKWIVLSRITIHEEQLNPETATSLPIFVASWFPDKFLIRNGADGVCMTRIRCGEKSSQPARLPLQRSSLHVEQIVRTTHIRPRSWRGGRRPVRRILDDTRNAAEGEAGLSKVVPPTSPSTHSIRINGSTPVSSLPVEKALPSADNRCRRLSCYEN